MKTYKRHVDGWCIEMDLYANRSRIEGQVADFVDCEFQPTMTLDQLKVKIERYIKTLPAKYQDKFIVTKWRCGWADYPSGKVCWYRVNVRYQNRWVVSVREPIKVTIER